MPMDNSIPKTTDMFKEIHIFTPTIVYNIMKNRHAAIGIIGLLFIIFVAGCRKAPQQPAAPESELSALYSRLREGYGTGDTATAFALVRRMLDFPLPADGTKPLHIRTLNRGLTQLMYRYAYGGMPDKGFAYFLRLAGADAQPAAGNPPLLPVPAECRRQILILAAYLGMLNGEVPEAIKCLEEGFALPEPPTPDERYADYTFAAAVYSQGAETIGRSIEMYEKALAEVKQSDDKSGLPWILGNLAELYADKGEFEKAVKMYYETIGLFKTDGDNGGLSETYASLAELYRQWGMPEQAEAYADQSLEYARLSGQEYIIGFSMLQKYEIAEKRQQTDSALYWLQRADSFFIASNSPLDHLSAQGFITRLRLRDPAYLEEGTKRLEEICADTLIEQTLYQPMLEQLLGECYLLLGRKQEGIRILKDVLPQLEESHKDVILLGAYRTLVRYYRGEKQYETALTYQDKADELQEKLFEDEKLHQVTASRVHYETTQKELENEVLQQKVELNQRTLAFTWVLVGLLGMLLVGGGLYARQRHRYLRRVSDARLSQISGLLQAQQELKGRNTSLADELSRASDELSRASDELRKASREPDEAASGLQDASERKSIADIRREISTQVFNSDKEAEFRRSFTALYPEYIPALHELSPDMTRTDELVAMLIMLDLSSEEIGLTLGVSRVGVNKARSRMRKRLGLESKTKLEDFLKGVLKP